MQKLIGLIKDEQTYLLKRILNYAKIHHYVKYTSTLEQAWVVSISGLSEAIINGILVDPQVPEINVDHDFVNNSISSFGIIQAQKHRYRGVTLEMFLGLMKYYRQAFLDLVTETMQETEKTQTYLLWLNRFFDHTEIAFCTEWVTNSEESIVSELQVANRMITNEKNKYLTIFESIPNPAIILDAEDRCINMNYAAQQLLQKNTQSPGNLYYGVLKNFPKREEVLPWLSNEFKDFYNDKKTETIIEKEFNSPSQGKRSLTIKFHRMLDVSNKFEGIVILFTDMTEHKKNEEQLRYLSVHDVLTGLYNRAYMEEELVRLATGRFNPVGFISIDVDGLKLVNDNLGHNAGDFLLVHVSQIIKKCFRECDVIVRMGGDEFEIIMPLSNRVAVQQACQRIRDKITEHNSSKLSIPISVSIGCSVGELNINSNIEELIKEADNQMYFEKQTNRLIYRALFNERLEKYGEKLF